MKFEGEEVDGLKVIIRQFKGDIEVPLTADEIVHLTIVAKVHAVSHGVNERDGRFYRVHELKVIEVQS